MSDKLVPVKQLSLEVDRLENDGDGIEMGVMSDGTPFLSGQGLARMSGVVPSAIIKQATAWKEGRRDGQLGKMLLNAGIRRPLLHIGVTPLGEFCYPDDVCMVILRYYAFYSKDVSEAVRLKSEQKYHLLAQAGFRIFVWAKLGYRPSTPEDWHQFHDRLLLNPPPDGYFSVLTESTKLQLGLRRAGLPDDYHTVPDASIGIVWSKHWDAENFDDKFGARQRHTHRYPNEAPQARSNPQEIHVYPDDAVGEFRRWLRDVYIAEKLPAYLSGQVKSRKLAKDRADEILAAVSAPAPKALPAKSPTPRRLSSAPHARRRPT